MDTNPTGRGFIPYPLNRVVGTIADAERADAAVNALVAAGFALESIDVLHGEEDLNRLDPTGAEHGALGRLQRALIRTGGPAEEHKHLMHHVDDVRAGRFVIMALAPQRERRTMASEILDAHGAEFVGFYGRWAWEGLTPSSNRTATEATTEDHAHAYGLERVFNESTLAVDELRIKWLSEDVAIVHAAMTLAGQSAVSAITHPAIRKTVFSFVVYKVSGRWMCASAHNTDVGPNMDTHVVDDDGVLRAADSRSGRVS